MIKFINRINILLIIFLSIAIIANKNNDFKEKAHFYLYEDNFEYSKIRSFYNKYLGNVFPFPSTNTATVFDEKLNYNYIFDYYDGCGLKVTNNYLVPSIKNGIVVYIGQKDNYGLVVIVNYEDDKNIWYGGLRNSNYKLYDDIKIGDVIGETENDTLYIVISENEKYLECRNYI